tara:strand:- start:164 stop:808 length:645 start_codon:yes stop_codon:yes gene_type:complete
MDRIPKLIFIKIINFINVIDLVNLNLTNIFLKNNCKNKINLNKKIFENIVKKHSKNIFQIIAWAKDEDIIKFAITSGLFNINIFATDNTTPLMAASYHGNTFAMKLLINYCSSNTINNYDNEGNTALWLASSNNKKDSVKELLKYNNLNLNCQDVMGKTALWIASACGNIDVVTILLDKKVKNIKDSGGRSALDIANLLAQEKVAEILKKNKYY